MKTESETLWLLSKELEVPTDAQRNAFLATVPINAQVINIRLSANIGRLVIGKTLAGYIYEDADTAYASVATNGQTSLWHINEILPIGKDLTAV